MKTMLCSVGLLLLHGAAAVVLSHSYTETFDTEDWSSKWQMANAHPDANCSPRGAAMQRAMLIYAGGSATHGPIQPAAMFEKLRLSFRFRAGALQSGGSAVRCGQVSADGQVLIVDGFISKDHQPGRVSFEWVNLLKLKLRTGKQQWGYQSVDSPHKALRIRFRFQGSQDHVLALDEVELHQYSSPCQPKEHPSCRALEPLSYDLRAAITQREHFHSSKLKERTAAIRAAEAMEAELWSLQDEIRQTRELSTPQQAPQHSPEPAQESYLSTLCSGLSLLLALAAVFFSCKEQSWPRARKPVPQALPSSPCVLGSPIRAPSSPAVSFSPLPKDLGDKTVSELEAILSKQEARLIKQQEHTPVKLVAYRQEQRWLQQYRQASGYSPSPIPSPAKALVFEHTPDTQPAHCNTRREDRRMLVNPHQPTIVQEAPPAQECCMVPQQRSALKLWLEASLARKQACASMERAAGHWEGRAVHLEFLQLRVAAQELMLQRCLQYCATAHYEKRAACVALLGWKWQQRPAHSESSHDRQLMMRRKLSKATRGFAKQSKRLSQRRMSVGPLESTAGQESWKQNKRLSLQLVAAEPGVSLLRGLLSPEVA